MSEWPRSAAGRTVIIGVLRIGIAAPRPRPGRDAMDAHERREPQRAASGTYCFTARAAPVLVGGRAPHAVRAVAAVLAVLAVVTRRGSGARSAILRAANT